MGIGDAMVEQVNERDVLGELCRIKGKWGMRISFDPYGTDRAELLRAAPYLDDKALFYGVAYYFGTEEEVYALYHKTVGPSAANNYDGRAHVYAETCDDKGNGMSENT